MKVSLTGMLFNAANQIDDTLPEDFYGLNPSFGLRELEGNLRELHARRAEPGILDEFFSVYVIEARK